MCIGARALTAGSPDLPGLGLDVPVDADGDGLSTHGDRYAFNYWLELGGDLATALAAAEDGKDGVIDLSKFFGSSDALLKSQSTVVEGESLDESPAAGGGAALTVTCATSSSIVAPFGAPTTPASLFMTCQAQFSYPTGADMDALQGLFCSRGRPTDADAQRGVVLLDLSQAPPVGNDGSIPLGSPGISEIVGFGAEDIVVRKTPPFNTCPYSGADPSTYTLSTWPEVGQVCPVVRNTVSEICGTCAWIYTPQPFAIDLVRTGMPGDFGAPEDVIFSATQGGAVTIRRAATNSGITQTRCYQDILGQVTVTLLVVDDDLVNVQKVWGLALGNFKGAGVFGAYFIAETWTIPYRRELRRLVWDQPTSTYLNQLVPLQSPGLPSNNQARSIAFDPVSGDLFVSEDRTINVSSGYARIWRINASGTVRLFGQKFNKPNGITFHPSGVLLVAEESYAEPTKGNVLAVGGWRNKFKRGDANGDGTVNISDPIFISNWLPPQTGPAPPCLDGADGNDDSFVNAADRDYILNFLFNGGPAPPFPGPYTCNRDLTADLLDCTKSLGAGCAIQ